MNGWMIGNSIQLMSEGMNLKGMNLKGMNMKGIN